MSVILGIDPGLATVGFGAIKSEKGRLEYLDCGVIRTKAGLDLPERLHIIKQDVMTLLETFKPSVVGVEELYFAKNVTNAIKVAHARGVILESLYEKRIPLVNFTPLQVKNNIAGDGRAQKWQIQEMVKRFLHLKRHPRPDDAADALAIAICTERGLKSQISVSAIN
ncbi:crossover junction endodeoxyribonuclease RuvC [Candidatus Peregrinibacteria bacterium]|nr:crossover junction endodeoxyribonuclease RuvC [Candidatus Peregrinibacteria bacterium]